MLIDKSEMFIEIQKDVMFDRNLAEEFGLALLDLPPEGAEIIIDGRMIAFLPERD